MKTATEEIDVLIKLVRSNVVCSVVNVYVLSGRKK